jgi:hypothetical protein
VYYAITVWLVADHLTDFCAKVAELLIEPVDDPPAFVSLEAFFGNCGPSDLC